MEFRILGPLEVVVDGAPIALSAKKQRALLALLLISPGRVLTTDQIIDALWGEDPPQGGARTLRVHVAKLRNALEPDRPKRSPATILVTEGGGYKVKVEREQLDAGRFEALCEDARRVQANDPHRAATMFREALDLWRGEPLADFVHEDFARGAIVRFKELRLTAMEDLAEAQIASDDVASAIPSLDELIDANPYRERLRALHMTALYRIGRQTEALRAYQQVRSELAEVGLEPSPELRELEQRIVDQDPRLGPSLGGVGPTPATEATEMLPAAVDRFVGREVELRRIAELWRQARLVTLVGTGGSGKTRLVLEAARRRWDRTARFADMTVATDRTSMIEALLSSLGLAQRHQSDPIAGAVRVLAGHESLLIIDSCEHLLDPIGEMVERLLTSCEALRVVATSREPLRVQGEVVMTVPPLELPRGDDVEAILASDSAQLFVERAQAVLPGFSVTDGNAGAVSAILAQVDGLPLAIELAAVQLQSSPLDTLSASLAQAVGGGSVRRTAHERHRTLPAALDWSYQLLDGSERQLLRNLGVMLTDFDQQAVQALGGSTADLAGLVSKSMVARVGETRYRLLVPVRQYAASLLEAAGEAGNALTRRNEHFVGVADELTTGLRRDAEQRWQERFAADRVHVVAALAALRTTDPVRSATLVADLAGYWLNLGLYSEGLRLVERALLDTTDTNLRCRLEIRAGWMLSSDAYPEAEARITTAMDHLGVGDEATAAEALYSLGSLLAERGHNRLARGKLQEAVELYTIHRPSEWFAPLANLALLEVFSGNHAEAARLIHRLRQASDAGEIPAAETPYVDLLEGVAARMTGDLAEANRLLARSTEGYSKDRYAYNQSFALLEQAIVQFESDNLDLAEELAVAAANPAPGGAEPAVHIGLHSARLLARLALRRNDPAAARSLLHVAYEEASEVDDAGGLAEVADTSAELAAMIDRPQQAADILAWSDAQRRALPLPRDPHDERQVANLVARLPPSSAESSPLAAFLRSSTLDHRPASS